MRDYGVEVSVFPFWSADAYAKLRKGRLRSAEYVIELGRGYLRRVADMIKASRADAVWIHRYAVPVGTGLLGAISKTVKRPLVFGYDDAVYMPSGKKNLLRMWFGSWRDVNWLISHSHLVIARNEFLATYARRHNPYVSMIPAGIDVSLYERISASIARRRDDDLTFVMGWIGTPATMPYLELARPALESLGREGPVELRVIGGGKVRLANVLVKHITWRQEAEVQELARVDVGIAPMPDDEWARGKSGLKVVQYMGCGIPVVASAVGVHLELLESGKQGFLVRTTEEWLRALRALRNDRNLRAEMGQSGQQTARLKHDLPLIAKAHADALIQVCKR
jgi:glycosyltransferase involved in cell wall biosynthesis